MGVSAVSSGPSACQSCEDRVILVAKKQQDVQKDQAQALVNLIKQSVDGVGQRINVYA